MSHPSDLPINAPDTTASTNSNHDRPDRRSTTIVLLDPTSPDGHSALSRLHDGDADILLVVLLTGRASNALREFAHHNDVSIPEAGWTYLDQVAVGLEAPGRTIGTIAATGPDTAQTLADIAIANDAVRVALPSSILRLDRDVPARLAQLAPVTVDVPQFGPLARVG
jgi:hypothetical protein